MTEEVAHQARGALIEDEAPVRAVLRTVVTRRVVKLEVLRRDQRSDHQDDGSATILPQLLCRPHTGVSPDDGFDPGGMGNLLIIGYVFMAPDAVFDAFEELERFRH